MTYGLVMIVRDEADGILGTLASLRDHIDYYCIVDTGSTDGTQGLIREYLKDIPGELFESPFVDFGTNRTEALALAHGKADWLIATDADMRWTFDKGYKLPGAPYDAVGITMGRGSGFEWTLPLILRGDVAWKSVGAVHEYTARLDGTVPVMAKTDSIRITYEDKSNPAKTKWQAGMLVADLERDPNNPRTVFYLAQCERELGHWLDSTRLYERRASMGGFEEERWYASYWAAQLQPDPDYRIVALMACWAARSHRLEPLYLLCRELNSRSIHAMVYALTEPRPPTSDTFFVHRSVWDWGMDFERSIAAWWVGQRDEAAVLNDRLLANGNLPADIRAAVERNMSLAA